MSAFPVSRRPIGATAAIAAGLGLALLLAACNNQFPPPPPVPGQPLTWAQKHQMDMLRYQQINQDRMSN